ncbi:excinuclease ABC subunit UvrA [Sediminispirochaeta smaragdinae]|jgi:excinuclease ABC subunit A|uniref:UvrABC system protein A n=1 Tax=Sediminispirochaeta smaragdinae (strain DSM 11293 / JCM 15392 / SEBR 4228) TaxID=573413 RepID=E1R3D5_SEDSS|nr:excinuclease ABC subunit UvrA [Sediminispirochaeta smaragdinae]ADK81566.1 excinuclease ABC, A subunit [Sediminispirochaeta smaragdinae DSM 11293]
MNKIIIKGAREHNLKNIDIELPRDSLIVVSGLSGSGKSSLAFDTIFAEGQRRYVESLSAYARQFLGRMDKPDLDYIEGLSPAISIEQKTTHKNPRSTVGTVTEIYDYYRLLWARIGKAYCPNCGDPIQEQSIDQILDILLSHPVDTKLMILAPVIRGKKGEHQKIFEDARKAGFVRVRVDGRVASLDEEFTLEKNKKHTIEIVVSRLKMSRDIRKRLAEDVETALSVADGSLIAVTATKDGEKEAFFSQKNACHRCGFSMPELQPRLFSFNNPYGACPVCSGLGMTLEFDPKLVIPDRSLSFNQGGIATANPDSAWHRSWFEALAEHYNFSLDTPLNELPEKIFDIILNGSDDEIDVTYVNRKKTGKFEYSTQFRGVLNDLKRRYLETNSEGIKQWLESFMSQKECPACGGKRLKPEALSVKVGGISIFDLTSLSVDDSLNFFSKLKLSETEKKISSQIMKEIVDRLTFMKSVGLEYLTLERRASTLSGGEAQRIRLATQIGSSLVGVLYILDEPTIGLHQRDNDRLIATLKHLRDIGNTLIVVEHDEQTLRTADYIVDLGPGAGVHGGHVIAKGTLEEILANKKSITGRFLSGKETIAVPQERRQGNGKQILLKGAREHNLKGIDVAIPLGKMVVVTGVSGSGKSTLVSDVLFPAISNRVGKSKLPEASYDEILGLENIDKIINIDQSPIGRTPRSNPATYVGLFTPIRELFASLPDAKARGYKPGRFSFNVKGGRCEHCQGDGTIKIEMHFLPDVYITCDVCKGKRFNRETLDIRYKGKNIHEVLEMTVEEAREFFSHIPSVKRKLDTLHSVGLDYIKLGQSALTLSGGEAQRVKLSLELSKRSTGKTFYLLDEPTTGLHFADVKKLMEVLHQLVDMGNTVLLIEHNLDVIKQADHIIDLGPEGGAAGGQVVVTGTPEEVARYKKSYTGRYLQDLLDGR